MGSKFSFNAVLATKSLLTLSTGKRYNKGTATILTLLGYWITYCGTYKAAAYRHQPATYFCHHATSNRSPAIHTAARVTLSTKWWLLGFRNTTVAQVLVSRPMGCRLQLPRLSVFGDSEVCQPNHGIKTFE
jgi:hypothetical protein